MEGIQQDHQAVPFLLKLEGKMTYEVYPDLEDKVIDAMRRYKTLDIDLSEVEEIDLCGLHLVGLLQHIGIIVAASPVVEQATKRLLRPLQAAPLGRLQRH